MEEKANELLRKANEDVEAAAKSHESAVILDGWTAPRAIGVIGIIVVSFLASAVQSFIQSESSSTCRNILPQTQASYQCGHEVVHLHGWRSEHGETRGQTLRKPPSSSNSMCNPWILFGLPLCLQSIRHGAGFEDGWSN